MSGGFLRSSFGLSFVAALALCVSLVGLVALIGAQYSNAQLRRQGHAVLDQVAVQLAQSGTHEEEVYSALLPSLVALPQVRRIAILSSTGTTIADYVSRSTATEMPPDSSAPVSTSSSVLLTRSIPLTSPRDNTGLVTNDADGKPMRASMLDMDEIRVELAQQPMPEPIPAILTWSAGLLAPALLAWLLLARRYYQQRNRQISELSARFEQLRSGTAAMTGSSFAADPLALLGRHVDAVGNFLDRSQTATSKHLERATADLQWQLEQLQQRNDELAVAHRSALEASHRKSAFLAAMSHEIRTPMNGVLGYLEVLGQTSLDASQRSHLDTAQASADRLMAQIDDILDFSKIEAGKLELHTQPYGLREMLENAVALFAPSADAKGLGLYLDVQPGLPKTLLGDEQRISQIIANLVSNAVKYTEVGHVLVHAGCDHSAAERSNIRITVSDTGPGIPAVQQRQLFAAFKQLPQAQKCRGTGLGLAICERLAELMGGRIELESKPTEGSQFSLCLPLDRLPEGSRRRCAIGSLPKEFTVHLRCDDSVLLRSLQNLISSCGCRSMNMDKVVDWEGTPADPDGVLRVLIAASSGFSEHRKLLHELEVQARKQPVVLMTVSLKAQDPPEGPGPESRLQFHRLANPVRRAELITALTPASDPAPAPVPIPFKDDPTIQAPVTPRPGMQVLLADDNPINRRLAGLFLQQLGARVTQAENGHMAIEACRGTRFDLILMDVHMPLIDGPEAAARIRSCSSQVNTDTPIVALTADIAENDRRRLLQQGLDAVETKPITQQALRHLLLAYQGRSEERNSVLLARTA